MASYGQLLSPASYEDANLFDQVEIRPSSPGVENEGPGNLAADSAGAQLSISVDDPVKLVEQTMIPGRGPPSHGKAHDLL
jgi:hypothetical protein